MTVIVADLSTGAVAGATEYEIVAGPVPEVFVIVTHGSLATAVQPQVAPVFSVTVPGPPASANMRWPGAREYSQTTGAGCVTVCDFPATVMTPVRSEVVVFGAAV